MAIMIAKHGQHYSLVLHGRAARVGGLPLRPKGLLNNTGQAHPILGHGVQKALLVPKN